MQYATFYFKKNFEPKNLKIKVGIPKAQNFRCMSYCRACKNNINKLINCEN